MTDYKKNMKTFKIYSGHPKHIYPNKERKFKCPETVLIDLFILMAHSCDAWHLELEICDAIVMFLTPAWETSQSQGSPDG